MSKNDQQPPSKKLKDDKEPNKNLPGSSKYWLTESSEFDCHFIVGPEEGPKERIGTCRIFLKGFSEPFRVLLGSGPLAAKGDIPLKNVKPATFKTFLKCVCGAADDTIKSLDLDKSLDFLSFTEMYLVTELKSKVGRHLATFLKKRINSLEDYFLIVSNPASLQEESLKKALSSYTASYGLEILSSELILQISSDTLLYIVKSPLPKEHEVQVWKTIVKWAKHVKQTEDLKILRETLKEHIEEIQFQNFTYEELCTKVFATGILSDKKVVSVSKIRCKKPFVNFSHNIVKQLKQKKTIIDMSISHTVENFSSSFRNEASPAYPLNYFLWWLDVVKEKEGDDSFLVLYLNCKTEEERNRNESWKCEVKGELTILSQDRKQFDLVERFSDVLQAGNRDNVGLNMCRWEEILDPIYCFSKSGKLTVRADFQAVFDFV